MTNIPITYQSTHLQTTAQTLASKWKYQLLSPQQIEELCPPFYLQLTVPHLQLVEFNGKSNPLFIDFNAGNYRHRRLFGGGKNQLIARAMGINKGFSPHIYDATAGLARDAFVLAGLGCKITMIERTNILAGLLQDALQKALTVPEVKTICANMDLIHADSIEYFTHFIKNNSNQKIPDIIYLDPMYPDKKGSALVKKEMQFLQQTVGKDHDASNLLEASINLAKYRVVVKRPKSSDYLGHIKPQLQLLEKKQRLDIYIIQKLPSIDRKSNRRT
ncbi:MAG: class I SAM-dependent methyltransferase [Gammaproteobacteria bacterium]|nr:class I SAM-dependent methyltransferase [Gammaproteobacteria bacterium]